VDELKGPLGESFSVVFQDIMNNALSHMPIDIWLLDQWNTAPSAAQVNKVAEWISSARITDVSDSKNETSDAIHLSG
jgi:hypothetical protein